MKNILKNTALLAALAISNNAFSQCADSNMTSAWDIVNDPTGTMHVTAGSRMGGTTCGLDVAVSTTAGTTNADKIYVLDDSPNGESRFRAAFCLDPNGVTFPATGGHKKAKIHVAQCSSGTCFGGNILVMRMANRGTDAVPDMWIEYWVRDNLIPASNKKHHSQFNIPDTGPQRIEYDLDINAGTVKMWLNATAETDPVVDSLSGLDLTHGGTTNGWSAGVQRARLGFVEGPTSITTGQHFYIDEYESRRQTFIGGTCAN